MENRRLLEVISLQSEIAKLGPDLGNIMALVADRTLRLTDANGSVIELAEGEDMVYRAAAGIAAPHLGMRLKRAGSLSGLCVETGSILRCDDSETDERVDREACRRIGVRSMLLVPLQHQETTVGALKVLSERVAAFDDDDIQLLGLMSDQIASAMYHATQLANDELFRRATHDPLTDIPNRALFYDRLRLNLQQARRQHEGLGVLMLDMDNLKPINDELGHAAGDAAIREIAARLKHSLRASDTASRLGGDEFGIIAYPVPDSDTVAALAQRISERIAEPYRYEQHTLALAASIGQALFPDDESEPDGLVEKADRHMYLVKRARKKAVQGHCRDG